MINEQRKIPQLIEHDDLIWMLPHKGKMFLLSRVIQHDSINHTIVSEYDITKDCIFYEEEYDGVPSWAGFEFMAQGISAQTGISNKVLGRRPRPGFILSVRNFQANVPYLKNNTTIQMKIAEDFRDDEAHTYSYNCQLFAHPGDTEPAATSTITVMETEDINNLFRE